IASNMFM
ncbi:hypothetical protein D030_4187B, partial [Vibrio parahaemolyticus AQ3810]